jgi:hypothetical protein
MHVSRALLKNTRASLRFHKRLIVFLVALLVVIVGLVALSSGLPQILTAGAGETPRNNGLGFGSIDFGSYSFETFTQTPIPTPTPSTTTTVPPTTTPVPTFTPLVDTPEFGVGGAIIALFACFVAFTLFMRRKSVSKHA